MIPNEGLEHILELVTGDQARGYWIGLCEDDYDTIASDAVLADLTELSGAGYARQAVGGFGTWTSAAVSTTGWKVTSPAVTFTANGFDWSLARTMFLVNGASKLVAVQPVNGGAGIALADGASYDMSIVIQLNRVADA